MSWTTAALFVSRGTPTYLATQTERFLYITFELSAYAIFLQTSPFICLNVSWKCFIIISVRSSSSSSSTVVLSRIRDAGCCVSNVRLLWLKISDVSIWSSVSTIIPTTKTRSTSISSNNHISITASFRWNMHKTQINRVSRYVMILSLLALFYTVSKKKKRPVAFLL